MTRPNAHYGLLAEFAHADDLVAAARRARKAGYRDLDAFTPFPVYELAPVLRLRDFRVRWIALIGGITGGVLGLLMQLYTNYNYPIDVGGRPVYALTAFSVVVFEFTVLFCALSAAFGMLALNGLPRLHHPVFGARQFYRASRDRFFLCVLASDAKFDRHRTRDFLEGLGAASVELVRE
jgi:hypothetical protein